MGAPLVSAEESVTLLGVVVEVVGVASEFSGTGVSPARKHRGCVMISLLKKKSVQADIVDSWSLDV